MLGTATKLQNARKITLAGAVSGNAQFDGNTDITINTTQDNIAILTGSMTLEANTQSNLEAGVQKQTSININFPSGFNKDNCVCIAFGMKVYGFRNYSYGTSSSLSMQAMTGAFPKLAILGAPDDDAKINLQVWQSATSSRTAYYKLVLMKIS